MAVPLLDLRAQYAAIKTDVVRAMMDVVDAQTFILGEQVGRLECELAGVSHTKYAVGCASGTDALLLALRALDIGRGDEVITDSVHVLCDRGDDPQRRCDPRVRRH